MKIWRFSISLLGFVKEAQTFLSALQAAVEASTTKKVSEGTEATQPPTKSYLPSLLSFLINNQQLSGPSQLHDQSLVRRGRAFVAKTRPYFGNSAFEDHVSSQLSQRVGVTTCNLIFASDSVTQNTLTRIQTEKML